MAALGMETTSGDFEVIDLCFAGLPDLLRSDAGPSNTTNGSAKGKAKARETTEHDGESLVNGRRLMWLSEKPMNNSVSRKTWVALVSGLSVGAQEAPTDLKAELLVEWLMGESGGPVVRPRSTRAKCLG